LKSMDILSFLMINIHTAEAEQLSRTVLEVRERSLGPDHIETLESVSHLALVLSSLYIIFRGNWDSAKTIEMESLLQRAVDGRERVLGLKHPDTLKSKNNLAGYLYLKGDIGSAEKLLRHVLSVEEQLLGPEHPNLLMTLLTLADLLRNKGDYSGAELLLRKSLNINMNLVGIKHQDTKNNIDDLAHLLELMGRDQEARSLRMKV